MVESNSSPVDPYRLLFPMGLLNGILGVGLWLAYYAGFTKAYPLILHGEVMIGAFLSQFAVGFLMTAGPKLTGSFPATRNETNAALALAGFQAVAVVVAGVYGPLLPLYQAAQFGVFLLLARFLVLRLRARGQNPPPAFVFVPFAIGSALICSGIFLLSHVISLPRVEHVARAFFYHGLLMALVIGVGHRLIPALLGFRKGVAPSTEEKENWGVKLHKTLSADPYVLVLFGLFMLSFVGNAFRLDTEAHLLRTLVVLTTAVLHWKIPLFPKSRILLSWGIWLSCLSICLGMVGAVVLPHFQMHLMHLTFVSGLGLLTLMVATRVTLAHGNHAFSLERNGGFLAPIFVLLLGVGIFRAGALAVPESYVLLLFVTASLWCVALLLWSLRILPLLRKNSA